MKRDTLVLVVAALCGLVAFSLIFNFLKQATQPKGQYVIAKQALAAKKVISVEDLAMSPPLENIPAANYFTQMVEVIGMEMGNDLPAGQLIARAQVKKAEAKPESPEKIEKPKEIVLPVPAGMRALTLGTQELESIPQTLKGGDYVDILGYAVVGTNQREIRTLLRGTLVLSVQKEEGRPLEELTIALHPIQVETFLNASKFGKMRLVITTKPSRDSDWTNTGSIEVIRGIQRERKAA